MIAEFKDDYWFLSNFSRYGFTVNSIYYPTNEHFYQAHKVKSFDDPDFYLIVNAETPKLAKKYGQKVSIRLDFDDNKINIMRWGLFYKYTQNLNILKKLLDTGDQELVEGNTWNDTYWGVCKGIGKNHLGKLHMEIRATVYQFINNPWIDGITNGVRSELASCIVS